MEEKAPTVPSLSVNIRATEPLHEEPALQKRCATRSAAREEGDRPGVAGVHTTTIDYFKLLQAPALTYSKTTSFSGKNQPLLEGLNSLQPLP